MPKWSMLVLTCVLTPPGVAAADDPVPVYVIVDLEHLHPRILNRLDNRDGRGYLQVRDKLRNDFQMALPAWEFREGATTVEETAFKLTLQLSNSKAESVELASLEVDFLVSGPLIEETKI